MSRLDSLKSTTKKVFLKTKQNILTNPGTSFRYIVAGLGITIALIATLLSIYNTFQSKNSARAAGLDCLAQNSATVNYAGNSTPFSTNQVLNNINQCSSSKISITKITQAPKVFKEGTQYYYTIDFGNTGSVDLKEVVISDQANSNFTFDGATCADIFTNTSGGATLPFAYTNCTVDNVAGTFSLDLSNNLVAGQSYQFRVLAKIKTGAPLGQQFPNNIAISGKVLTTNQIVTDTSSDIVSRPDITITKTTQAPAAFGKGREFYYNIVFTNPSAVKLTNITIADTLPSEVEFAGTDCVGTLLSATGNTFNLPTTACTVSGQNLSMTLTNPMLPAQQLGFRIRAKIKTTAPDTGTFVNNISITGTVLGDDGTLGEQVTAQSSSNVQPIAVFVEKTVSKNNVSRGVSATSTPGDIFDYTITYGNYSNQNLTNIAVTDQIPSQYAYVEDGTCAGCTYNSTNNQLTWTGLSLLQRDEKTLTFKVQVKNDVALANNVCNQVTMTVDTLTTTASACNNIVNVDVTITKTAQAPKIFKIGTQYYYTIEFTNNGTVDLKDVVISDQADSNLIFAGTTCSQILTSTTGSATLPFNINNCVVNNTAGTFSFNLVDNLLVGQSYQFRVLAKIKEGAPLNQQFPNNITITGKSVITDEVVTKSSQDLVSTAAIDINKTTQAPAAFGKGREFYYDVNFSNPSSTKLTNVIITDTLPAEVEFVDTQCLNVLLSGTGAAFDIPITTCTVSGQTLTMNLANPLNPAQQLGFRIKAKIKTSAPNTGTFVNNINIQGTILGSDGITTGENVNDQSSSNVQPVAVWIEKTVSEPNVSIGKTATNKPGDIFDYTITYGNYSNQNLTNIAVTDQIPSQYAYVEDGTCAGCTYNSTNNQLTWTGLSLLQRDEKTLTFKVQVKNDVALANNVCNQVTMTVDTLTTTASACNNIVDYALTISKIPSQYLFEINPTNPSNTNYTYYLDYENKETTPLTGVVITDTLDPRIDFIPGSCTGTPTCTYDSASRTLTWAVGNMAPGPKSTGRVSFKVNFVSSHTFAQNEHIANTAIIDSNETPPAEDPAYVSVRFTNPDIDIDKQVDPVYYNNGDKVVYPIAFKNKKTTPLTGVYITDKLDSSLTYTSCTGNPICTYDPTTRTVRWNIGNLGINETRTYYLTVTINGTGVINNKATIFSNETEPDFDDVNIIITPEEFKIKIVKYASASTVRRGDTYTYTLDYFNPSNDNLTGVVITDTLDTNIDFVPGSCKGDLKSVQVINCTYDSTTRKLTWTIGSMIKGRAGTVTFDVKVKADAPIQTIPNTAIIDSNETEPDDDLAFVTIVDYALTISKIPSQYLFEINPTNPSNTNYTYYLDYENKETTPLTGVVITDTLDPRIDFIPGSCTGTPTCTYDSASRTLTWAVGNMAPGPKSTGRVSFKVNFVSSHTFAQNEHIANTAIIDSNETPPAEDPAYVSVRFTNPDIDIDKQVDPVYYNNGDKVVYPIAFKNKKTTPLTGVYITDKLDSSLTYTSCTGNPICTYDPTTRTVRWNIGNLGINETRTYYLTVTINGTGVINNKATIFSNETEPDFDDVNIIITPEEFKIKIVKYASASTVRRGDTYTYTLDYFNPSNDNLTGVVITDTLDTNIDFVPGSCKGDLKSVQVINCTYDSTTRKLTWTIGSMIKGRAGTVTFDVKVKADAPIQTIPNTAIIDSNETEPDDDLAFVTIVDYALTISKIPSQYLFEINPTNPSNTNYTYYLDYENKETTPLTGVVITDTLDPRIDFIPGSCTGTPTCTYDSASRTLTWAVGNMAPGPKSTGRVSFKVNFVSSHTFAQNEHIANTAIIDSNETPPAEDPAYVSVRFTNPDIDIDKQVDPVYYNNGDKVVYPIAFKNKKTTPLTGVYITDKLDSSLTYTSCTGNPICTYDPTTRTVRWNIGNLGINETRTYYLTVTINGTGVINNKATIFSNETEPDFDDVNIIITPEEFKIKIVKYASASTVRRGDTYTYTLDYFNPSNDNLTGVVITDTLDTNIDFVPGSCKGDLKSVQVINCTYDSTTRKLTWTIGSMIKGRAGTVTFDVKVKADAPIQTIPNTAIIDSNETEPDDDLAFVTIVDYALTISKIPSQYLFEINPTNPSNTNYTYYLDYENKETTPLTGVVITDTLDPRIDFIPGSCTGTPTCTYDSASRTLTWAVGNMAPGPKSTGRVSFKVNFVSSHTFAQNEHIANTAIIDSNETPPAEDPAYVSVRFTNPDIDIDKQVDPVYYNNGDKVVYPIAFKNKKTTPLTGVYITDKLDSSLTYTSCTGNPICTYDPTTRTVRWNIGNLGINETRTYYLTVTINGTGVINNKATIFSNETEPDFDDVNIIITPEEFKIKIVKYASASTVRRGDTYTYTLDYFNPSNDNLTGVVITDTLDTNIDFVPGSCKGDLKSVQVINCTYDSTTRKLTWTIGSMIKGRAGTVTFDVKVKADAPIQTIPNTAIIDSNETEPDDDLAFVTIVDYALTISKIPSQYLFEINPTNPSNTNYTYYLDYENKETTPLTGVVITDTLDPRIDFIPGSCTGTPTCTYDSASRTLTWAVGNMAPGPKSTGRVSFKVNFVSSHTFAQNEHIANTAIIDSNETPPAEDPAYVSVRFTNPDIDIDKQVDPVYYNNGDKVVYPIAFKNKKTTPLTGVYITDKLDSSLTYTSCTGNPICTYDPTTRTVRWNIGNLGINETRTYYLTVTINGTGVINNKATIFSNETEPDFDDVNIIITPEEFKIKIVKYASASTVRRGDTYTYTLDYFNPSNDNLTGVVITDTLDTNIDFVPGSCKGDLKSVQVINCTYDSTTRKLTWTIGSMIKGRAGTVTFDVKVKADAPIQTIPNTAIIDSNETEPDDDLAFVDIVDFDLNIIKTVSDYQFIIDKNNPGATEFVYTLSYSNVKNQPLTNVVITDTLDNRLTYISCSDNCTYDNNLKKLTWTFPNLVALGQGQVTIRVKLNAAHAFEPLEYIPNTAIIDSNETEPRQSTFTVLIKYYEVQITKTVSKSLVNISEIYTYYIDFKNATSNPLTNTVITDRLTDNRINYVDGSCTLSCTYDTTTRTLTWNRGQLAGGKSGRVEFKVVVLTGINVFGDIVNKATITTTETPPKDSTVNVQIRNIITDPIRTGGIAIPFAVLGLLGLIGWRVVVSIKDKKRKLNIDIINKP